MKQEKTRISNSRVMKVITSYLLMKNIDVINRYKKYYLYITRIEYNSA